MNQAQALEALKSPCAAAQLLEIAPEAQQYGADVERDALEGMKLPPGVVEYLLKPSVILKNGETITPKKFIDDLLADGYGNPMYFSAPKGTQAGYLSKKGSPKATLNDKQMFYADAAFMNARRRSIPTK